jgi:organic radical activating enzyme
MDYYCSNKFSEVMVHIQGRLLYNCHRAYPERINIDWLENNPGKLFHTDTMIADRNLMLDDKACTSCHYGCYRYEEQGLTSTRLLRKQDGTKQKISDPYAPLRKLQIMLSTDCNLACVYCSPEFSTRWQREISDGGKYIIGQDFIDNDKWSTIWSKIKQKDRSTETRLFDLLLREISLSKGLQTVSILGGEPLLNNRLPELIKTVQDKEIYITTGLGIGIDRLRRFLDETKGSNIKFHVSGESTHRFFEFIRYGKSWRDFKEKIDLLETLNYDVEFISTISNLCMFDFYDFYIEHVDRFNINLNPMHDRNFLAPHVMDDLSKEKCQSNIDRITNSSHRDTLTKMISLDPTEKDRTTLGSYLKQLSVRRRTSLDFLPKHFRQWCGVDDA